MVAHTNSGLRTHCRKARLVLTWLCFLAYGVGVIVMLKLLCQSIARNASDIRWYMGIVIPLRISLCTLCVLGRTPARRLRGDCQAGFRACTAV